MKFITRALLGAALLTAHPVFAAAPAPGPAVRVAADAPHVKAVEDLLAAMQAEKVLRGVAARSRYQSLAQRNAVLAKVDATPPAQVYRRMAAPLASAISTDTATEMTRFYNTPYGKQVIYKKYNNSGGMDFPGARPVVSPEEKKERKRAAYVQASKELAAAEPAIEHEAFVVLQAINKEKR